jgi:hypothetical protein
MSSGRSGSRMEVIVAVKTTTWVLARIESSVSKGREKIRAVADDVRVLKGKRFQR